MAATSWQKNEYKKIYQQALFYAHQGVKAGKDTSAYIAGNAFYHKNPKSSYKQWGIPEDKERSRRYGIISDYLTRRAHLKPELNVHESRRNCPATPGKTAELGR